MKKLLTLLAICFTLTASANNPIDSTIKTNMVEKAISMQLVQRAQLYSSLRTAKLTNGPGCPMQYELLEGRVRRTRSLFASLVIFAGTILFITANQPQ